jgi:aspartate/methionine/tyrosine aminotransferase
MIDDALATLAVQNSHKIRERNEKIVNRNFGILSKWVEEEPLIDWVPPRGGTIAFLRYDMNIPSDEFCLRLMREKDVLLVPGSCFGIEGFIRIGWGGDTETLKEGLSRFKEFLKDNRN